MSWTNEAARKYYRNNKEKINKRMREYRLKKKEEKGIKTVVKKVKTVHVTTKDKKNSDRLSLLENERIVQLKIIRQQSEHIMLLRKQIAYRDDLIYFNKNKIGE